MTTMNNMRRGWGCEIELCGLGVTEAAEALWDAGIKAWDCNRGIMGPRAERAMDTPSQEEIKSVWRVVTDGSVSGGAEVVSPVLSGDEGLESLRKVVRILKAAGARVDNRCGFHVHVDARDLEAIEIVNAVVRYAQHETLIDSFMAPRRRGSRSEWCRSMEGVSRTLLREGTFASAQSLPSLVSGRYFKLNIHAFIRHGSLEFRQHAGTMNINKMVNWIIFCVNFVENSRLSPEFVQNFKAEMLTKRRAKLANYLFRGGEYDRYVYNLSYRLNVQDSEIPALLEDLVEHCPAFRGVIVGSQRTVRVPAIDAASVPSDPVVGITLPSSPEPFQGLPASTAAYLRARAAGYASPFRSRISFENGAITVTD